MGKFDGFYRRVIDLDDVRVMGRPQPIKLGVDNQYARRIHQRSSLELPPIRA